MTTPNIKLPPEVVKLAKRPEVRLIAGAALGGLALGLYVGIKIAGPRNFTPSVKVPTPCADCAEKARTGPLSGATGIIVDGVPVPYAAPAPQPTPSTAPVGEGLNLSPTELAELRARIEAQVAYPVIPPPIPDPAPVDG